jgi:hypothetical protein
LELAKRDPRARRTIEANFILFISLIRKYRLIQSKREEGKKHNCIYRQERRKKKKK